MNYLKVGKATDLQGKDRLLYRFFEMLPGLLSYITLLALIIFSYFQPVWVAFFIIAFDVYWLLLVIYLALYLVAAYRKMKKNSAIDWQARCNDLSLNNFDDKKIAVDALIRSGKKWTDLQHLVLLPTYNEGEEIITSALQSLLQDGFPAKQMIVVVAMEERAGEEAHKRAINIQKLFQV